MLKTENKVTVFLEYSVKDKKISRVISTVIQDFENRLPNRILGYYLLGSYTDGLAVEGSDIDIVFLFKDEMTSDDKRSIKTYLAETPKIDSIELDIVPVDEKFLYHNTRQWDENILFREGVVNLKLASAHVYGRDDRDKISLPVIEDYIRVTMHTPYHFLYRARKSFKKTTFPLQYPDSEDEFYGYVTLRGGQESTKQMISIVGWICTALVALRGKEYVGKKSDFVSSYKNHVGGGNVSFVEDLYVLCRNEWNYVVPKNKEERSKLKYLCEKILAFENDFLEVYRKYLEGEVRTAFAEHKTFAQERLNAIYG